ncbi:MAG: hypothetical protein LBE14_08690, partial [Treponema sp.]|nr:hypothetical protein [Treponema sp.]
PGEAVLTAKTSKNADQPAANNITTHTDTAKNHANAWNSEAAGAAWTSRWNDRRYLRIWESADYFGGGQFGAAAGTSDLTAGQSSFGAGYTAMAVKPGTREIYGSWDKAANAAVYFGKPDKTAGYQVFWQADPPAETDIAVAGGNNITVSNTTNGNNNPNPRTGSITQNQNDSSFNGTSVPYFAVVFNATGGITMSPAWRQESGGLFVWDPYQNRTNSGGTNITGRGGNHPGLGYSVGEAYIVEKGWRDYVDDLYNFDAIMDRFMSPHAVVDGEYIHVVYHDRIDRSLKYWWNKARNAETLARYSGEDSPVGGTNNIHLLPTSLNPTSKIDGVTVYARRWVNLDGGYNAYDNTQGRVRTANARETPPANPKEVGVSAYNGYGTTLAPSGFDAAGEFNAIDFNREGYPVIAYYDMKNQALKIAYASKAVPLAGTDWAVQTVGTSLTGTPAGQYVSMRIDRGASPNRIHIAFFRSGTGELVYLQGTRDGNAYDFDDDSCVAVDSTGTTGKWADISLDRNGNPWITYQDIARGATHDAVKAAYLPNAGARDTTLYKEAENWETMHVPSRFRAEDARLSIENPLDPSDGGWDAAVGYQSDYFRIAYFHNN